MTNPSQEAVEKQSLQVLLTRIEELASPLAEVMPDGQRLTEIVKLARLIGVAYEDSLATFAQTIREENDVARLEWFRSLLIKMRVNFTDSEKGVISALEDEIQKAYQALTPTTNHTGETNP